MATHYCVTQADIGAPQTRGLNGSVGLDVDDQAGRLGADDRAVAGRVRDAETQLAHSVEVLNLSNLDQVAYPVLMSVDPL